MSQTSWPSETSAESIPFRATYYVDPNSNATPTGSQSNPFTSIAAAQAAAAAASIINAIFILPPSVATVENITIPAAGDFEIYCTDSSRLATITGALNILSGSTRLRLTNVTVSGAVTGDAATGQACFLVADNARLQSTLTLTATGTGAWNFIGVGRGTTVNSLGGFVQGACSVVGVIDTFLWSFQSSVTWSSTTTKFQYTQFNNGSLTNNGAALSAVVFQDCIFAAATTINGAGAGQLNVIFDGFSLSNIMSVGLILSGTAGLLTASRNISAEITAGSGNLGSTNIGARVPAGCYTATVDVILLTAGSVGSIQVNAIYTNMAGTLTTLPLLPVPLSITGSAGSEASAVVPFKHNGSSAPLAYSITGIVTAGTLVFAASVVYTRVN